MKPCMTAEEWAGWQERNAHVSARVESPCVDCTCEFAAAMRAIGRCNGEPATAHRPLAEPADPRTQRRREQWRVAQRRKTARMRVAA